VHDRHVDWKRELLAEVAAAPEVADQRLPRRNDLRKVVAGDHGRNDGTKRFGYVGDRHAIGCVQDDIGPRLLCFRDAPSLLSERIEVAGSEHVGFCERVQRSDRSEQLGIDDCRFGSGCFEQLTPNRFTAVSNHPKCKDRTERQRGQQGSNDEEQQVRS
jgi:hypothetical protein